MLTKAANPTADELCKRARGIAETLHLHRRQADQKRDISSDVIEQLHDAGLFRMLKPRKYGGFESDPRDFYAVQNILAEQCLSTAWVFGVLSIQAFFLALFPEQARDDVWGDHPDMLVSSSFRPCGTVRAVEGGYRISGQWGFSSGSSHAGWALLGGLIPSASEGGAPEMRLFLVPRRDYAIIDTWHTFGLRGTGSNDIRVEDAFVPVHRSWRPTAGMTVEAGGTGPELYRLPWLYMFPSCVSNLAIGAGRGALRIITAAAPKGEAAQLTIGRAHAEIEGAAMRIDRHIAAMCDHVASGTAMPMAEALLYRGQLTATLRSIAAHVDALMLLTGGHGIAEDGPLTRVWLDLSAARHHMGNAPDPGALALAGGLAGTA